MGHNTLKKLKDIYEEARMDLIGVSNHSFRATEHDISKKIIMECSSGHLSTARVRSYKPTSEFQKKTVGHSKSINEEKPSTSKDLPIPRDKENFALKQFKFEKLDGFTFNFNFK